jgi:hypothetical protein
MAQMKNASRFGSNGNVSLKKCSKLKPSNFRPPLEWRTWEGSSFCEGFFASLE